MKATHQYSSTLLLIRDNVEGGECLAHSCHYHIPLKIITLSFSHANPITIAKRVCLQSPQEFELKEVSNWTVLLCKKLLPSHLAILLTILRTTSHIPSHPPHPAFLMFFKQYSLFSAPPPPNLRSSVLSAKPFLWPPHLSSCLQPVPTQIDLHTTSGINGPGYDSLTSDLAVSLWQCPLSNTLFFSQNGQVTLPNLPWALPLPGVSFLD